MPMHSFNIIPFCHRISFTTEAVTQNCEDCDAIFLSTDALKSHRNSKHAYGNGGSAESVSKAKSAKIEFSMRNLSKYRWIIIKLGNSRLKVCDLGLLFPSSLTQSSRVEDKFKIIFMNPHT